MNNTETQNEITNIERRGRPRKIQPENEEPKEKAKRGRPKKEVVKGYDPEYFRRYYAEKRLVECYCGDCGYKFRTLNALKQHKQNNKSCLIQKLLKQIKENSNRDDGVRTAEVRNCWSMMSETDSPYNPARDEGMIF